MSLFLQEFEIDGHSCHLLEVSAERRTEELVQPLAGVMLRQFSQNTHHTIVLANIAQSDPLAEGLYLEVKRKLEMAGRAVGEWRKGQQAQTIKMRSEFLVSGFEVARDILNTESLIVFCGTQTPFRYGGGGVLRQMLALLGKGGLLSFDIKVQGECARLFDSAWVCSSVTAGQNSYVLFCSSPLLAEVMATRIVGYDPAKLPVLAFVTKNRRSVSGFASLPIGFPLSQGICARWFYWATRVSHVLGAVSRYVHLVLFRLAATRRNLYRIPRYIGKRLRRER